MAKTSFNVRFNSKNINKLQTAGIKALEMTAEALHTEVLQAEVMPFDKGTLQGPQTFIDRSKAKDGKVSLVSNTPYARRLYFHPEYNFNHTNNKRAGGKWLDPWISGNKKRFCQETFSKFYKKEAGL